jgi:hypothetical protein
VYRRVRAGVLALGVLAFGVWMLWFPAPRDPFRQSARLDALEDIGRGTRVRQGFTAASEGLRAVSIHLASSSPVDLRLEYRVSTDVDGQVVERYRATRAVTNLNGRRRVRLEFLPLEPIAGKRVILDLRVVSATPRGGGDPRVALLTARQPPPRRSYLLVDEVEYWGVLDFDAEAIADSAVGRFQLAALQKLPEWLQSPVVLLMLLAAYGGVLVWSIAGLQSPGPSEHGSFRRAPSGLRGAVVAAAVCALVLAALGAATWIVRAEGGRFNLIDDLHAADLKSAWALHEGFEVASVDVDAETLRAVIALPASRIAWRVTVPPRATLVTAVAIVPSTWSLAGDGAHFVITAEEQGRSTPLFSRTIDPRTNAEHQRWVPVEIDLQPFAGRAIDLVFVTEGSAPGRAVDLTNDFAAWGAPRITQR